jgi:hypothetical protein
MRPAILFTRSFIGLLSFAALLEAGVSDSTSLLMIDGVNGVLFNQEYPGRSLNMYSTIYGNPLDSFPHSYRGRIDTTMTRLSLSGGMASETGDAMLNIVTNPDLPNRGHQSFFESAYAIPNRPARLFLGYRYNDMYSDRFDSLMDRYTRITQTAPAHADTRLERTIRGGYSIDGTHVRAAGLLSRYQYTGVTPFYFYPLYKEGYDFTQTVQTDFNGRVFQADLRYDRHYDYFDYTTGTFFEDWQWGLLSSKPMRAGTRGEIFLSFDSRLNPAIKIGAALYDTLTALPLSWHVSGGIHGNARPFAALDAQYRLRRQLLVDMQAAWQYTPRERAYAFPEKSATPERLSMVEYHPTDLEARTFHTALRFSDTILFPFHAAIWYDYNSAPLWERISDMDSAVIVIRQDTITNGQRHTIGGKARYEIAYHTLRITLWGNAILTPSRNAYRFTLPRVLGADIGWGAVQGDSFYAGITAESRDRAILRYWNDDRGIFETMLTFSGTRFSGIVKVPFLLPVMREHLAVCCWIKAGPFSLGKSRRMQDYSRGNLFGPAFSVRFDATMH